MTDSTNIDSIDFDTEALDFDTEALDPKTVSQAELDHYAPLSVEALNELLPQYEFIELIAVGGMGAIYKALQTKLDRLIAVKILPKMDHDQYGFAGRFEQEAKAMAKLSHPHIVPIFDFGETETGQAYFVMEYVEGADMLQLICGGQLTLAHFFGWIPQVCSAIQYAHDQEIVHRDIKPANILIDKQGNVKMADFGLAKLTGTPPIRNPEDETSEEDSGEDISMGTPGFAAPEQFDNDSEVDGRADIYALGVVMYQMLTGQMPVGAFPMPSECNPHIDIRLDEVVMRAMQQDAEDRFQTISEISDRLNNIHATENSLPVEEEEPEIDPTVTRSGKRLITGSVQTFSPRTPATNSTDPITSGKVTIPTDRVKAAGTAANLNTGKVAKMPTSAATPQPSAALRRAMAKRDSSTPIWAVFAVIAVIIAVIYVVAFSGKDPAEKNSNETGSSGNASNGEPTATEKPIANPNTEAGKRIEKIVAEFETKYDPEVNLPHEESISKLNDLYAQTLESEKADATEDENLKLVEALQTEIESTPKGEAPGSAEDANLHQKILKMRSNYHRKLKSLEMEKKQDIQDLEMQLDSLLETLQNDYSIAENRSAALDVENYRRKRKEWQNFISNQSHATE